LVKSMTEISNKKLLEHNMARLNW